MNAKWLLVGCLLVGSCAPALDRAVQHVPLVQAGYIPGATPIELRAKLFQSYIEWLLHVKVVEVDREDIAGSAVPGTISIARGLAPFDRFAVMAHEAAHLLQPPSLADQAEMEVWAEAVALEVAARWGVDTRQISARYLAQHKQGLFVLRAYRHDIAWAVTVLSGRPR